MFEVTPFHCLNVPFCVFNFHCMAGTSICSECWLTVSCFHVIVTVESPTTKGTMSAQLPEIVPSHNTRANTCPLVRSILAYVSGDL